MDKFEVSNDTNNDNQIIENIAPYALLAISVFGVFGNGLIIIIVLSKAMMRTIPNIFLLSVAIGDFILVAVCPPLRMVAFVSVEWTFGNTLCMLNEFIITLSQGVSIFTLTALAGDRFRAIVLPMRSLGWETKKKTISITVGIWFLAFLFALPDLLTSGVQVFHVDNSTETITWCNSYHIFSNDTVQLHRYTLVRRTFNLFVYYIIPLIIITVMYIAIAVSLKQPSVVINENMNLDGNVLRKHIIARKRVAKIVIIMAVCFIVCWTPRHIFIFITNYTNYMNLKYDYRKPLMLISFWLSFLNSCINPPILYVMSSDFRRHFDHYFCWLCCKAKRNEPTHRGSDFGLISFATNNIKNIYGRESLATIR